MPPAPLGGQGAPSRRIQKRLNKLNKK